MEEHAKQLYKRIRFYTLCGVIFTGMVIAVMTLFALREGLLELRITEINLYHTFRELTVMIAGIIILIACFFGAGLNRLMKPLTDQLLLNQDELQDLVEKKQKKLKISNEKLLQLAMHDPLTNLLNRRGFNQGFERELMRCRKQNLSCALFFIDVDKFKRINDEYGHTVGDTLLIHLANQLQKITRREDMVARVGGDEFVILVPKKTDQAFISDMLNRLEKISQIPIQHDNHSFLYSISIGISICPRDGETTENLLKNADKNMYHHKLAKTQIV